LCLEDNNLKAKELYQKYNSIESEKIEHPEFYRWSSGGFLPPYSCLPCQTYSNP
jgi:hypothetical protein